MEPASTKRSRYLHASSDDSDSLLSATSSATRLSHAMLMVPSVDETVAYWKKTASQAQVTASSKLSEDSDELRSAMVVLGDGWSSAGNCFALELVKNKSKNFELGNVLSYLGISMLLKYQSKEDLVDVIVAAKNKEKPENTDSTTDPNGIPVKPCASAPGDYLARLCLRSNNMQATRDFYSGVLGMKVVAVDQNMLCLRYAPPDDAEDAEAPKTYGVPTTLVFEPSDGAELDMGNCFDHIVIATQANIDEVFEQVQTAIDEEDDDWNCPTFMKPTEMFGKKVCGFKDPNGYKVILAG